MTRKPTRTIARGSALAVAMIILGVLTVVGVAAVSLSTQERSNAAAFARIDTVQACANAAAAKIWRELGVAGSGAALGNSDALVTSITLADGTRLTAPAHYDQTGSATIKSVITTTRSGPAAQVERNWTNIFRTFDPGGGVTYFDVHCRDAAGRELELEIGMKFAL